jgi:hypothetical protein
MSTQKQQGSKQGKSPANEAAPPRREDHSQQRANNVDPRGSNQTPQTAPTGKRSDEEDFTGPPTEKRDHQKTRRQSDIPKRQ